MNSPHAPFKKYPWYIVLALSAIGFGVSLYLAHLHYAVHTDYTYTSFCAVSRVMNCQTVAESVFSVFLGVPVAVWGMLGYTLIGVVCWLGLRPKAEGKRMWMILYVLMAVFCSLSIALFIISKVILKSYCIMCLITYGVNFALLALAMHLRSSRKVPLGAGFKEDLRYLGSRKRSVIGAAVVFLVISIALPLTFPPYWRTQERITSSGFHSGVTKNGHHWIGAVNPVLTINEYSDYRCFYCRKAHYWLRKVLEENPEKVRIVHHHYPLDSACNPAVKENRHAGACLLALWANCAGKQGKFWEMHDLLFDEWKREGHINARELADKIGLDFEAFKACLKDDEMYKEISRDVLDGLELEIKGTPFYVIDGQSYTGAIPPEVLEKKLGKTSGK